MRFNFVAFVAAVAFAGFFAGCGDREPVKPNEKPKPDSEPAPEVIPSDPTVEIRFWDKNDAQIGPVRDMLEGFGYHAVELPEASTRKATEVHHNPDEYSNAMAKKIVAELIASGWAEQGLVAEKRDANDAISNVGILLKSKPYPRPGPTPTITVPATKKEPTNIVALSDKETATFSITGAWVEADGSAADKNKYYGPRGSNLPADPDYSASGRDAAGNKIDAFWGELIIYQAGKTIPFRAVDRGNGKVVLKGPGAIQMVFNDDPRTDGGKRYDDNWGEMTVTYTIEVQP